MEIFKNLNWRPIEPAELNALPTFLSEETIEQHIKIMQKPIDALLENIPFNLNQIKKEKTIKDENSKIPGYRPIPAYEKTKLTLEDHKNYVDVVEYTIKGGTPSAMNAYLKHAFNNCQKIEETIQEERQVYANFVKEKWKTSFAEICKFIDTNNNEYFEKCWEKRIEILGKYPQYYQPYRMIPLVFKSDTTCEMKMIQTFLEKGTVKGVKMPNDKNRFFMKATKNSSSHFNLRDVVSNDHLATRLADMHNIDVVISASGVKTIIDNSDSFNNTWYLPVCIKEVMVKHGSQIDTRKIVFVDKALPKNRMDSVQKNYWVMKRLVKLYLCKGQPYKYPPNNIFEIKKEEESDDDKMEGDPIIDNLNPEKINFSNTGEVDCSDDQDSDDELVMDLTDDETQPKVKEESVIKADCSTEKSKYNTRSSAKKRFCSSESSVSPCHSSQDSFGSPIRKVSETITTVKEEGKKVFEHRPGRKLKKNVNYRQWILTPNVEEHKKKLHAQKFRPINILIRTKIDAQQKTRNGTIEPLVISPKLEYQLQYGAETFTKGDLCRQYVSSYIRPCSKILRVRVDPKNSEFIKTEECSLAKIATDANLLYGTKLNVGWSTLYSVLLELLFHPPGKYMLCHTPRTTTFASLLKTTENSHECTLNLDDLRDLQEVPERSHPWVPLDCSVLLPNNSRQNAIPGLFKGKPNKKLNKKKKSKKNNSFN